MKIYGFHVPFTSDPGAAEVSASRAQATTGSFGQHQVQALTLPAVGATAAAAVCPPAALAGAMTVAGAEAVQALREGNYTRAAASGVVVAGAAAVHAVPGAPVAAAWVFSGLSKVAIVGLKASAHLGCALGGAVATSAAGLLKGAVVACVAHPVGLAAIAVGAAGAYALHKRQSA